MNISVIGVGKLGVCWSLALENAGYKVLGIDLNQEYVDSINNKILQSYEPEVESRLKYSRDFRASTSIDDAVNFSDIIFLFVATPSTKDGRYDHTQINSVVDALMNLDKPRRSRLLVVGCTVFPGYCDELQKRVADHGFIVVYNPQFIAQGSILRGQEYPDTVLVGSNDQEAIKIISDIHKKVVRNDPLFATMPLYSAEITKLSLNCFITTKIAFANMVGDLVLAKDQDPALVLNAIGSDSRVGLKCMLYGYGYGGPCFPRDNRALSALARDLGFIAPIGEATDRANEEHLNTMVARIQQRTSKESPVVFDYVTYKPGTILIDESQPLKVAARLASAGYTVIIRDSDPVIDSVKGLYGDLFSYEPR